MILLLLAVAAILPDQTALRERCDLLEVNHFYDDRGRLVFDQVLFYDWSPDDGRYQLRAWRVLHQRNDWPQYQHSRGLWEVRLTESSWAYIGDKQESVSIHRVITAPACRESWTQYDPELTEREFLPKEKRRELRKAVR